MKTLQILEFHNISLAIIVLSKKFKDFNSLIDQEFIGIILLAFGHFCIITLFNVLKMNLSVTLSLIEAIFLCDPHRHDSFEN